MNLPWAADKLICGDPANPGGQGLKRDGTPCGQVVIPGTYRCYIHGGHTPMAKLAAEHHMALLRMPAIESLYLAMRTLTDIVEGFYREPCETCGYPSQHPDRIKGALRAARGLAQTCAQILDRTGLGPSATLNVQQSDGAVNLASWSIGEKQELVALLSQVKALKDRVALRQAGPPPLTIEGSSVIQ